MLFLKYLLLIAGYGLIAGGLISIFNNVNKLVQYHRKLR
jgi:hypothetical protein